MSDPFFGVRSPTWLSQDSVAETRAAVEWAVQAERLGYDVFFVADRLLATARGSEGLPVYESTMVDPYLMLSTVAARTSRLRLATLVTVVPFRHPAVMAKLTASLDVLSNGRHVFGAGSGWSDPELRMFGIDRRGRGQQMEEAIELVRRLWTGEPVTAEGRWWQLNDVQVLPRPVQRPGPPVWLGSFSPDDVATWSGRISSAQERALRRVGRIADAWVPLTYSAGHKRQLHPAQLAQGWEVVAASADAAGRRPDDIDIVYAHWIAIVRNTAERRACESVLAKYFPGTYDDARVTYLIGTPEEIAERVRAQTAELERVDGYLFTPINDSTEQLEAIATDLCPLLT